MPQKRDLKYAKKVFRGAKLTLEASAYMGNKHLMPYTCMRCGHRGESKLNTIQQGRGCPVCGRASAAKKQLMKIKNIRCAFKSVGLSLKHNGLYGGSSQPLSYKCDKCKYSGMISYGKVRQGRGCKACGIKRRGQGNRLKPSLIVERLRRRALKLVDAVEPNAVGSTVVEIKCEKCKSVFAEKFSRLQVYKHPCPICRQAKKIEHSKKLMPDLNNVRKVFAGVGLQLLATSYNGSQKPLAYRCKRCGFEATKTFTEASCKKSGCLMCGRKTSALKRSIDASKMIQMAKSLGVSTIENPKSMDDKIRVRFVSCGHEQKKSISALKYGSGCSICSKKQVKTLNHYQDVARANGGQIIEIARNSRSKAKWKCSIGHEFRRPLSSIISSGGFCPQCSARRSEQVTKSLAQALFGRPFDSIRLRGSKGLGGRPLQLDLFNGELKLAIEHHGRQHLAPVEFFGGNVRFKQQQKHDQMRRDACAAAGIRLIEIIQIGEVTSLEDARSQIAKACDEFGIKLPPHFWRIDVNNLSLKSAPNEYWGKVLSVASERGFTPKGDSYVSAITRTSWVCVKGHTFQMRPRDILYGRTKHCPICYKINHYCPVLLSNSKAFENEAEAARHLGVSKAAVNRAVRDGSRVGSLQAKRISYDEYLARNK